jgi:SAM-dependent methyltransferase
MDANPWEDIYHRDGHVFTDIPLVIPDFASLLAGNEIRSILDLGCGNGRLLNYFAGLGYRVTGMDSAPTALRLSREWLQRGGLSGNLLLSDMRFPFPLADECCDALVSTQVIHHAVLETVLFTVSEITRVVRPGGLILVTVPVYRPREAGGEFHESDEIEYHTFVPLSGTEKGLPHHLFTPEEFGACFPAFDILSLEERGQVVIVLIAQKRC